MELLAAKHARDEPIVMITAYDVAAAQMAEAAGVDLVLVGDTAAETVLGYQSTARVSVEEMLALTAAVRRGLRSPLLVGDLPFGTYEASDQQAVGTAQRFVKEAGADVVKLERGGTSVSRAATIVEAGVPVMGHLGVTPQTEVALGGRLAQGRTAEKARGLLQDALPEFGCSGRDAVALQSQHSVCCPHDVACACGGADRGDVSGPVPVGILS